jgi:hypothetical protein
MGKHKRKKLLANILGMILALTLTATAAAAPGEFSLSQRTEGSFAGLWSCRPADMENNEKSPDSGKIMKRPWLAAAEVLGINVLVWSVNRYIQKYDYSRISWESWKRKFSGRWVWCADSLGTGFLGHPYHGSQYFNAARSLGLSFWESVPYAAGGYLMWGFFFESDPLSKDDLVTTTLGGVNLGELQFRFSSLLLDDSGDRGGRTWRHIAAFLIDPIHAFNRLVFKEPSPAESAGGPPREPLHGTLSFGGELVSRSSTLSRTKFSGGLKYDMIYGMSSSEISSRSPFDLIFLSGELRAGDNKGFLNLNTYGLLFGGEFGATGGPRHVLGIFQHYDYINDEILRLGGTSITGGLVSLFPLGRGAELKTSLQLGGVLMAGSPNQYVRVGQRNFNYGTGEVAKAQAWLSHSGLGSLTLRFNYFLISTIEASAPTTADISRDNLSFFAASYSFPLSGSLGLRLDYGLDSRHLRFDGHPSSITHLSRAGAAVEVRF